MAIKDYCLGIRLDANYQEQTCRFRHKCTYYRDTDLGVALSHPDEYQELDTYNSKECKYIDKSWLQSTGTCETSDSQTDGLMTLWSQGFSK